MAEISIIPSNNEQQQYFTSKYFGRPIARYAAGLIRIPLQ